MGDCPDSSFRVKYVTPISTDTVNLYIFFIYISTKNVYTENKRDRERGIERKPCKIEKVAWMGPLYRCGILYSKRFHILPHAEKALPVPSIANGAVCRQVGAERFNDIAALALRRFERSFGYFVSCFIIGSSEHLNLTIIIHSR